MTTARTIAAVRPADRERRPRWPRSVRRIALGAVGLAVLTVVPLQGAAAAPVFTASITSLVVTGSTATVAATFTANPTTTTQSYSVCLRSSTGANYDFAHVLGGTISSGGTAFSRSRELPAGNYLAYGCVRSSGTWLVVGTSTKITVSNPVSAAAATSAASCAVAPTSTGTGATTMPVGDLNGWKQVVAQDFTTAVPLGSFASSTYGRSMLTYSGYRDTSGNGLYDPAKVLSVQNGVLDWNIRTVDGTPRVAALVPRNPTSGWGQTYGRYAFRFRADTLPAYKLVGMLWPDGDNWGRGEIDFPEVNSLTSAEKIYANMYQRGNLTTHKPGPATRFTTATAANASGWHTATIEWSPGCVTYWLDGIQLGTHSVGVPDASFHLVLQVETVVSGRLPDPAVAGHVQVDWLTMYERRP